MDKKTGDILKKVLNGINPSEEELKSINQFLKDFISNLEKKLRAARINAEVFVGGSFAKKTMIKKGDYDIDIFLRFDEKYKNAEISKMTLKLIKEAEKNKKIILIHGSRDYFKVDVNPCFFIEVIPVIKITKPKEAVNITDLSYFHVNYIKRKIKTEKMLEEIRLAKAFCHANKCYGAESYINGFSGYALELLIYHYKSFLNFAKAMTKIKEREMIDIERLYKNRQEIAMNMNSAKMNSPVILIDPTFKERNALAALSKETFEQFKSACRKFLKKPTAGSFEIKKTDLEKIKKDAQKNKAEFMLIILETNKQEGDIAGSKLIKFYRHLSEEIEKFYKISNKGFNYSKGKKAEVFFVVKSKGEIIANGPDIKDKENVKKFRGRHKHTFAKNGKLYAKEKISKPVQEFIKDWKSKNKEKIKEMCITKLEIIE